MRTDVVTLSIALALTWIALFAAWVALFFTRRAWRLAQENACKARTLLTEYLAHHSEHCLVAGEAVMLVFVNGRPQEVAGPDLSYAQAMALAFGAGPRRLHYTVTYRSREKRKGGVSESAGSLAPGESVALKPGMIVNVAFTGGA